MADPTPQPTDAATDAKASALFGALILQQSNMAMLLLGRLPHPEGGDHPPDLDAARFFIDQLEMLEVKTRGNLDADESRLLQQTLMQVRLAYVEEANKPRSGPSEPAAAASPSSAPEPVSEKPPEPPSDESPGRRFSKRY